MGERLVAIWRSCFFTGMGKTLSQVSHQQLSGDEGSNNDCWLKILPEQFSL
jgi:hypothetical protein